MATLASVTPEAVARYGAHAAAQARDGAAAADARVRAGAAAGDRTARATVAAVWAVNAACRGAVDALVRAVRGAGPPFAEAVAAAAAAAPGTVRVRQDGPRDPLGPCAVTGAAAVPFRWHVRFGGGRWWAVASAVGEVLEAVHVLSAYRHYHVRWYGNSGGGATDVPADVALRYLCARVRAAARWWERRKDETSRESETETET